MPETPAPRLVGRDLEHAEGGAFLAEISSGQAQALVVTGEPGVGKTALTKQIVSEAEGRGFNVAWSWCWTAAEAPPFWPWRQVARELSWVKVDWTDIATSFASIVELVPEVPVLIVLDDAHGADESSLELVNLLIRSLRSTSIGFVLTVCEEDVPQSSRIARLLDEISRGGRRLDLFGLDKAASLEVFKRAGGVVPPLIEDAIASASDGNPFLIEQLAREASTGRDLHRPDRSLGFNVPRGAAAVLERVLRRLSAPTLDTLSTAAILGRAFSVDHLASVSGASPDVIIAAITEGAENGAVRRVDSLGTYEFTHALLRERLYEDAADGHRRATHLAAARILEERDDPTLLVEVAQHFFKAGTDQPDVGHAVDVIARAGREAEASGSPDGAARLLYRAARLARAAGLAPLAEKIEAERDTTRHAERLSTLGHGLAGTFKRDGEFWSVGLGTDTVLLRHSKGMAYLLSLISTPQKEWHCLELASPGKRAERPASPDTGPVLDAQAKKEFRQRLLDLEEDIAEAAEYNDDGRLRRAEDEKQFLMDELAAATGLGGRDRKVGSDSERARASVTRAIRAALRRISAAHPAVGDHLDRTIQTGTFLSYRPDPIAIPEWQV